MKKIIKNGVISFERTSPLEVINRVGMIAAFLLIVLGSVGFILFQTQLRRSFDDRQQASVADGKVLVAATAPTTSFELNQPATITLTANTQNVQVSGIQLVFNVITNGVDVLNIQPQAASGLKLEYVEVERTQDGFLVAMIALPNTIGSSFGSNTATPFAQLTFTPTANSNLKLAFDTSSSLATVHDVFPPQDDLKNISDVTFTLGTGAPVTASPTATPSTTGYKPLSINTNFAIITADEFYSVYDTLLASEGGGGSGSIAGTKLWQNPTNVAVTSHLVPYNSATADASNTFNPDTNTPGLLVAMSWTENNRLEQIQWLFVEDGTNWRLNLMRIYKYDIGGQTGWKTYSDFANGKSTFPRAAIGSSYTKTDISSFISSENGVGEVYFKNLKITPYFRGDHPGTGWTTAIKQCSEPCSTNTECGPNRVCTPINGVNRCRIAVNTESALCVNPYAPAASPGTGGVTVRQCNENCSTSAECQTGYRCYNDGSGSRCRLADNVSSSTCAANNTIAGTRSCNEVCSSSSECVTGYMCFNNRCRRPENPDSENCNVQVAAVSTEGLSCRSTCSSNRDCGVNLRCYQGECRHATNPASLSCAPGTGGYISSVVYGPATKGEIKGAGDTSEDPDFSEFESSISGSTTPRASTRPTNSMDGSDDETIGNQTLWQRLTSGWGSNGRLPLVLLGIGVGIFALVIIGLLAARAQSGGNSSTYTSTGAPRTATATKYENDLQSKINTLRQAQTTPASGVSSTAAVAPIAPLRPVTALKPAVAPQTAPARPVAPASPAATIPAPAAPTAGFTGMMAKPIGVPTATPSAAPEAAKPKPFTPSAIPSANPANLSMVERLKQKGIKPPQS